MQDLINRLKELNAIMDSDDLTDELEAATIEEMDAIEVQLEAAGIEVEGR